uniref:Tudor domain-containing protein n=1 Tax=Glossina brevipalpis TaxID=37001 RepID=A0A1A9WWQ2_9MUSC
MSIKETKLEQGDKLTAEKLELSTSKISLSDESLTSSSSEISNSRADIKYKIGDYVHAKYKDGKNYEAQISAINLKTSTCILKCIGYNNLEEVSICDLFPSWGKKARNHQFQKSKTDDSTDLPYSRSERNNLKKNNKENIITPLLPIPPVLTTDNKGEESGHLTEMITSWYMCGYNAGILAKDSCLLEMKNVLFLNCFQLSGNKQNVMASLKDIALSTVCLEICNQSLLTIVDYASVCRTMRQFHTPSCNCNAGSVSLNSKLDAASSSVDDFMLKINDQLPFTKSLFDEAVTGIKYELTSYVKVPKSDVSEGKNNIQQLENTPDLITLLPLVLQ